MSDTNVRELSFPGQRDRVALQRMLVDICQAWWTQWAVSGPATPVMGADGVAVREPGADDFALAWAPVQPQDPGLWISVDPDRDERWRALLLGEPGAAAHAGGGATAGWATDVVDSAHQDLATRLSTHLGLDRGVSAAVSSLEQAQAPYAGTLLVSIDAMGLRLLIDAVHHCRVANASPPAPVPATLSPLTTVLRDRTVGLALSLGETQATVEDLTVLREGDVIRFPTLLKDPLPLTVAGQPGALLARVGAHEGRWAVGIAEAPKAKAPAALAPPSPPAAPAATSKAFALPSSIKLN